MENMSGSEYLERVLCCLRQRLEEIDSAILKGQREIEDMHEYYWENYAEMDQYGYEEFDNRQALLSEINADAEQRKKRYRFIKMMDSPFFGRVDFCYEGEDKAESFYIGIGNLARNAGGLPLVYDWRAPVSALFYDYDKGAASYEAPGGEFAGEIISKWQYKIRGGKLIYEFESDVKIDDDILKAELGSRGEVQLKNIIRTIQKEQNAIIRNTKDRILVIQGAAGSGKTSIALHRIAYLLYHDRQNLRSSDILILSPNSVFADYISHVLPELGEENIREMSFDLFAYHELKEIAADCEDRYDQIERELYDNTALKKRRKKESREFIQKLDRYVLELEDDLVNFCDMEYRGFCLRESEMIELFYFKFSEIPLLSRMDAVAEYFIDQIETLYSRDLSEEEQQEITEKFYRLYETQDIYVLYSRFLKKVFKEELPKVVPEKRRLRYEDVAPVLYLKYSLMQTKKHSGIRHLVIDEMQDYSCLQYMILCRLFSCRMTILGDHAQSMEAEQRDVLKFMPSVLGRDMRIIELKRSYRNTVEIAQYANKIAGIRDMQLFERHGAPVTEKSFDSMEAAVDYAWKKWKTDSESYETGAMIFLTEEEAHRAFDYLSDRAGEDEKLSCSYIDRNSSRFCRGLTVTTFYLAKGLEFDCVFGIMCGNSKAEKGLRIQAEYITATRAMHALFSLNYKG